MNTNPTDDIPAIQFGDYPAFYLGNVFTVEFWFRQNNAGARVIFGDRTDSGVTPPTFSIEVDDSGMLHFITNDGCDSRTLIDLAQTMGPPIVADEWTHIAYTWDATAVKLYRDGALSQEFPLAVVPCDHDAVLRFGVPVGPPNLNASLDELKISSVAKSAAAISMSRDQDPASLLATCGDRVLYASEICDTQLCCDPTTCKHRPDGTACAESGSCESGTCRIEGGRITQDLELLYLFDEGAGSTLRDSHGGGPDLVVRDPGNVAWVETGLRIDTATVVESVSAPSSMHNRCVETNEVTVEVWVTPVDTLQSGPARIVSYAKDSRDANFMLGQSSEYMTARLRTSTALGIGKPRLTPEQSTVSTRPTHLILTTNASGERFFYIDGNRKSFNKATGDLGTWNAGYALRLANEIDEITGVPDRPWLGTFHKMAVYCRGFSASDAAQNFSAGM